MLTGFFMLKKPIISACFSVGILFGNLNAMAMAPFGHIAGVASAVIGNVSTMLAVVFGTLVGQFFDGSVLPLVTGFGLLACGAAVLIQRANVIQLASETVS